MKTVAIMLDSELSLRKALHYGGCSRAMYYHKRKKDKNVRLDPAVVDAVKKIAVERPFYGTKDGSHAIERVRKAHKQEAGPTCIPRIELGRTIEKEG